MPDIRPPGPYPINGVGLETWLVRFDKNGVCSSPQTRDALLKSLAEKSNSRVLFFSHGWNDDFAEAVALYRKFLIELQKVLVGRALIGTGPIFVGITWPSVWLPSEAGPQMAGADDSAAEASAHEAVLRELVNILPADTDWSRLYALLEAKQLSPSEARELAQLLRPALTPSDDGGSKQAAVSEDKIVEALIEVDRAQKQRPVSGDLDAIGTVAGAGEPPTTVAAAGALDWLDPRAAFRLVSLYIMKDRAGTVGWNGVATLLREMLERTELPIHAIGHSYGGKVMLSALAAPAALKRKLTSLLLLEPAVSHLSFAATVPGRDGPGGYLGVLDRVEHPIFSTFSGNDFPLHEIYHHAMIRREDLGELQVAAEATAAGNPPNFYAALGGYGPRGANEKLLDPIPGPGDAFKYPVGTRLVGLDGTVSKRIDSHGDVANPYTAWALYKQMTL
jgi:hypothetical protein